MMFAQQARNSTVQAAQKACEKAAEEQKAKTEKEGKQQSLSAKQNAVKKKAIAYMQDTVETIAGVCKRSFIIGGTYISHSLGKSLDQPLDLYFGDYDVYREAKGSHPPGVMKRVKYNEPVDLGLGQNVEFIDCTNTNVADLLANHDINSVGAYLTDRMSFDGSIGSQQLHIDDDTWHFLFVDQVYRAVSSATPSQTSIRILHKAWKNKMRHDEETMSYMGVLYRSHFNKHNAMKALWSEYPFAHLDIRESGPNSWRLHVVAVFHALQQTDPLNFIRNLDFPGGPLHGGRRHGRVQP
jgi:hypothetical protein